MLHDSEGFSIPWTSDDAVIEAGACDPDYGPPEGWPSWCDDWRFSPTEDDVAWVNTPPEPTNEDLEEMARYCEAQDRLEAMHYIDGDEAAAAAGLAVG